VRVRELAAEPGGDQYTALLRDLFDLDLDADSAERADLIPSLGNPSFAASDFGAFDLGVSNRGEGSRS